MLPRAIPVTRYCARSLVTPASWSWDVLPLPAVDGDHRHGTVVEPVVVFVAEVEDAGDPDEVLDLLDLIADLRGVVAGLLHGEERDVEGVPRVAAERRRAFAIGLLVLLGVRRERLLLRIAVREGRSDEQLAHRGDDAVGRRAREVDEVLVADPVAVVDGELQAEVGDVLRDRRRRRRCRPDLQAVGTGA